jgi:DNA-binding FadR family transcriptional regulator
VTLKIPPRRATADAVFDQLALAILRGDLVPGQPLPAERVLAEQADCSRIIVRQAVHRLADLGLVRARQGSATRVLDPADADWRVVDVMLRLSAQLPNGDRLKRELADQELLWGVGPLTLAALRIRPDQRQALLDQLTTCADDQIDDVFWAGVVDAAGSQVLAMEMRWFDRNHQSLLEPTPPALLRPFYLDLVERLRPGGGAAEAYLSAIRQDLSTP